MQIKLCCLVNQTHQCEFCKMILCKECARKLLNPDGKTYYQTGWAPAPSCSLSNWMSAHHLVPTK